MPPFHLSKGRVPTLSDNVHVVLSMSDREGGRAMVMPSGQSIRAFSGEITEDWHNAVFYEKTLQNCYLKGNASIC